MAFCFLQEKSLEDDSEIEWKSINLKCPDKYMAIKFIKLATLKYFQALFLKPNQTVTQQKTWRY